MIRRETCEEDSGLNASWATLRCSPLTPQTGPNTRTPLTLTVRVFGLFRMVMGLLIKRGIIDGNAKPQPFPYTEM